MWLPQKPHGRLKSLRPLSFHCGFCGPGTASIVLTVIDPGFNSVASIGASRAAHFINVPLLFDGYHRQSIQLACLGEGFLFTLGERREDQGL